MIIGGYEVEICRGYRRGQEGLLLCCGRPNPFLICAICLSIKLLPSSLRRCLTIGSPCCSPFQCERERLLEPVLTSLSQEFVAFILFPQATVWLTISHSDTSGKRLGQECKTHKSYLSEFWKNTISNMPSITVLWGTSLCLCCYDVNGLWWLLLLSGNCVCVFWQTFSNLYLDLLKICFLKLINVLSKEYPY